MENINIDEDGYINTDYYITAAIDIFKRSAEDIGFPSPYTLTTLQHKPLFRRIYNTLFKPEGGRRLFQPACIIPYNTENIYRLIIMYQALCGEFKSFPSIDNLELITGIDEKTLDKYVTDVKSVFKKMRKAYLQEEMTAFPLGVITLANNDIDSGLCYSRQNITDRAAVQKALSFDDLLQIAQKKDGEDTKTDHAPAVSSHNTE